MKQRLAAAAAAAVLLATGAFGAMTSQNAYGRGTDPVGIPDHNPVFSPDDDGTCEKHETKVKVTPSGNEVNVPCHAGKDDDAE